MSLTRAEAIEMAVQAGALRDTVEIIDVRTCPYSTTWATPAGSR